MVEDVSHNELNRIINRAIEKSGYGSDARIDSEVNIFYNKYKTRQQTNPQISIFEDKIPTLEDVKSAKTFCENLEEYRKELYAYEMLDIDLSENICRQVYKGLEKYESIISPGNKLRFDAIKKNVMRNIPELKGKVKIEEYNETAINIHKLHKEYKKNHSSYKNYEMTSLDFFREITKDEDLKEYKPSPEKLQLYQNCVKIVDCLPKEKYGRMAKFRLKRDIYKEIGNIASQLGENYEQLVYESISQSNRYQNAIETTQSYIDRKSNRMPTYNDLLEMERQNWWLK